MEVAREEIFKIAFQNLNAPLIRLTETRAGFFAITDDFNAIDQLTSQKAVQLFRNINLSPITPPDLKAKRTIFVRQIDHYAGSHSAEEIRTEIEKCNKKLKLEAVIKIKNFTHVVKLVAVDTKTAQEILLNGLVMFHTRVTSFQCEQEKYVHLLICFKCYQFEDHPTHSCKSGILVCSECAKVGHTYHEC